MFSVIFEVGPRPELWDSYLGLARLLKPELERIDGFIDNVRYRSLTRDGWLLSLSGWRDEKALVRWRIQARHHDVQGKGRSQVFRDYHLRVGSITRDTRSPAGSTLTEDRQDVTRAGEATTVTLIDATRPPGRDAGLRPDEIAARFGLRPGAAGLVGWDVLDAVLAPDDVMLLASWRDEPAAEAFEAGAILGEGARLRRVRVVRDYGMFDRREAPQYFPDEAGAVTIHS